MAEPLPPRKLPTETAYGAPRTTRLQLAAGHELALHQWGPASGPAADQPPVLLVHATGFHGRCWDQVVAGLPPGLAITAVDMRGHGASGQTESYGWDEFGADLIEVADHLELVGAVVVGHSMGGHCAAQLAAARPARCAQLLLLDPVIFEPAAYPENRHRTFASVAEHPVARRRNQWASWEAMRDSLRSKGFYGLWDPRVFDDYCRFGSRPNAEGVELACQPQVEAAVYLGNTESDVHALLASITAPTQVLRAPPKDPDSQAVMDFSKSPTWPELAAQLVNGKDVLLAHLTHFIPMQAPALVASYIAAAVTDTER